MRFLASALVLLLSACAPASPPGGGDGPPAAEAVPAAGSEPRLSVSPDPAAAGETVTLRLANGTSEQIGYNLCTSQLQREVSGSWEPVESDRICTMELRLLQPGGEDAFAIELEAVTAGRYRFVTSVERAGAMQALASEPFRVR